MLFNSCIRKVIYINTSYKMNKNKLQAPGGPVEEKVELRHEPLERSFVDSIDDEIKKIRNAIINLIKNDNYCAVTQFCDGQIKYYSKCIFEDLPVLNSANRVKNYLICVLWNKARTRVYRYSVETFWNNKVHSRYSYDRTIQLFFPFEECDSFLIIEFLKQPSLEKAIAINNACIGFKIFDEETMDVVHKLSRAK